MIQNDVKATELSPAALERAGICRERWTTPMKNDETGVLNEPKVVYEAKAKTFCEIVDTEQDVEIEGSTYRLFALTNLTTEEVSEEDAAADTTEE